MDELAELLDEFEKLCDAATEGPLQVDAYTLVDDATNRTRYQVGYDNEDDGDIQSVADGVIDEPTAKFFAESRTAMPRLIEALREAWGAVIDCDSDRGTKHEKEIVRILKGEADG